jgi:hypothetical protein
MIDSCAFDASQVPRSRKQLIHKNANHIAGHADAIAVSGLSDIRFFGYPG